MAGEDIYVFAAEMRDAISAQAKAVSDSLLKLSDSFGKLDDAMASSSDTELRAADKTAALADANDKLAGSADKAAASQARLSDSQEKLLNSPGGGSGGISGVMQAAGLGMIVAAGAAIKMAGDFDQLTERLVSTAGESPQALAAVQNGILNLSTQTGVSADNLATAMYTVESAGYHGANGLTVLKAAAEAAQEEGASTATVADALTSALNAYGLSSSSATQMTNEIVTAVSQGKMNLQLFAGSLSNVLPVAAAAGLSFAQVGGAVATMTSQGVSAQQATQDLANAIRTLEKPNQQAQQAMQQLGVNVTDLEQNLGKRGLTGTFQILSDAITSHMGPDGLVIQNAMKQSASATQDLQTMLDHMSGSTKQVAENFLNAQPGTTAYKDAMKAMRQEGGPLTMQFLALYDKANGFNNLMTSGSPAAQTFAGALQSVTGNATAMQTMLQLSGTHAITFNDNVKAIGDAAKKTGGDVQNWDKVSQGFNLSLQRLVSTLGVDLIKAGNAMLPTLTQVVDNITKFLGNLGNSPVPAEVFHDVMGAVTDIFGVLKGVIGFLVDHGDLVKLFLEMLIARFIIIKTLNFSREITQWVGAFQLFSAQEGGIKAIMSALGMGGTSGLSGAVRGLGRDLDNLGGFSSKAMGNLEAVGSTATATAANVEASAAKVEAVTTEEESSGSGLLGKLGGGAMGGLMGMGMGSAIGGTFGGAGSSIGGILGGVGGGFMMGGPIGALVGGAAGAAPLILGAISSQLASDNKAASGTDLLGNLQDLSKGGGGLFGLGGAKSGTQDIQGLMNGLHNAGVNATDLANDMGALVGAVKSGQIKTQQDISIFKQAMADASKDGKDTADAMKIGRDDQQTINELTATTKESLGNDLPSVVQSWDRIRQHGGNMADAQDTLMRAVTDAGIKSPKDIQNFVNSMANVSTNATTASNDMFLIRQVVGTAGFTTPQQMQLFMTGMQTLQSGVNQAGQHITLNLQETQLWVKTASESGSQFQQDLASLVQQTGLPASQIIQGMQGAGASAMLLAQNAANAAAIMGSVKGLLATGNVSAAGNLASIGGKLQLRGAGGPVTAGQSYITGDTGPELFTPNESGYITPLSGLSSSGAAALAAGGGGGGGTVVFDMRGSQVMSDNDMQKFANVLGGVWAKTVVPNAGHYFLR